MIEELSRSEGQNRLTQKVQPLPSDDSTTTTITTITATNAVGVCTEYGGVAMVVVVVVISYVPSTGWW